MDEAPLEARESLAVFWGRMLLALPILAALAVTAWARYGPGWLFWFAGSVFALSVVAAGVQAMQKGRRARSKGPALRLDAEGVHDHRLGLSVPWRDVTYLRVYEAGALATLLCLGVRTPEFYLEQLSAQRALQAVRGAEQRVDLTLQLSDLDAPAAKVERVARAFWERARQAV